MENENRMIDAFQLLTAIDYAAMMHKLQRRKGYLKIPYINHPIKVCQMIASVDETDPDLLIAAVLHDTLEDTSATQDEIKVLFGANVLSIVEEVTDDMDLPEKIRKELQVTKASKLSRMAKIIKVADKICNIHDILTYPIHWGRKRKIRYVEWSMHVFEGCRGQNEKLDQLFIDIYNKGLVILNS